MKKMAVPKASGKGGFRSPFGSAVKQSGRSGSRRGGSRGGGRK